MSIPDRSTAVGRAGGALVAALMVCFAGSVQPAVAQNPFEALFGSRYYNRPEPLPPRASSYADPLGPIGRSSNRHDGGYSRSLGGATAFCVRTCDGRYFPLRRHAGVSPAKACRAFCPASRTMVFSGSKIDYAAARNGKRYADLKNAFVYRDRMVANCTCNGKDALGLAHQSVTSDPTLRPGDIVATNDGFVTYRGKHGKTAAFTPIDPSSSAWARKLSKIKVQPAPSASKTEVAPISDEEAAAVLRNELRRAQLER